MSHRAGYREQSFWDPELSGLLLYVDSATQGLSGRSCSEPEGENCGGRALMHPHEMESTEMSQAIPPAASASARSAKSTAGSGTCIGRG